MLGTSSGETFYRFRMGMFCWTRRLGTSELVFHLPVPSMKRDLFTSSPCHWEWSVLWAAMLVGNSLPVTRMECGILSGQREESLSVFHAISILRSGHEPHITVSCSFSLKSLFINFLSPWSPLLNIRVEYMRCLPGWHNTTIWMCKAEQNKWENLSNGAFTPHIKHNTITYMPLDWTLSNTFLG